MSYIYLATPYSDPDPEVRFERYMDAVRAAAFYLEHGWPVLSPIAHTHVIAETGDLPTGYDFWRAFDEALIRGASEVWVLVHTDAAHKSEGVQEEIRIARRLGKPVRYVDPLTDPPPKATPGPLLGRRAIPGEHCSVKPRA